MNKRKIKAIRQNVTLSEDQKQKLEQIRDKDRHFNLSEKVGEMIESLHQEMVVNQLTG